MSRLESMLLLHTLTFDTYKNPGILEKHRPQMQ